MVVDDDGKERGFVGYPGNARRYLGADSPCYPAKGYRPIASRTGLFRKYPSAPKAGGIAKDGPSSSDDQLSRLATIGQPGPRHAETPSEDPLAVSQPRNRSIHRNVTTSHWLPNRHCRGR